MCWIWAIFRVFGDFRSDNNLFFFHGVEVLEVG